MKVVLTGSYRTRDGRVAIITYERYMDTFPFKGIVLAGYPTPCFWSATGLCAIDSGYDLVSEVKGTLKFEEKE